MLTLAIYLALPVVMGVKEGLVAGFLPALLWPLPVLVAIVFLGSMPFWAGALLGDPGFAAVWIAEAGLVIAVGARARGDRSRVRRAMATAWGIVAACNLLGWAALGPYPD